MKIFLILLSFSLISPVFSFTLSSGKQQPTLIELYTSEGCSSCPPADKWLKKFKNNKGLWTKVIPLAFHVDYWDYLGWKDKLALPLNSTRQHAFAAQDLATATYTPEVLQNGQEWRSWRRFFSFIKKPQPSKGTLTLDIQQDIKLFYSNKSHSSLIFHFAILGFDIKHQILAGENKNKTLTHDFVVLTHQKKTTHNNQVTLDYPIKLKVKAKRYAVVAWLENNKKQQPLQAVGAWLETDMVEKLIFF